MARPKKQEVDYFPHYCEHGKVLFILENKWGNNGYAFFYKLCELLGKKEGHSYDCNEIGSWEYLLAKTLVSGIIATEILDTLSAMKIIDPGLWGSKVIWMQSFVDSITDVYARRVIQKPHKPGLLHTETPLNGIPVIINPQSKVKYSKGKEKKKIKEKKRYGESVLLTDEEYLKLCEKFTKPVADDWIERLNEYAIQKARKFKEYTSHYMTILHWDRLKQEREKEKQSQDEPEMKVF